MKLWYIVLALVLLAGCAGNGGTAGVQDAGGAQEPAALGWVSIDIKGFAFAPATIMVMRGTTVTWTNLDSASHTVSADGYEFDSGTLKKGDTFSQTFNDAGTFAYHCNFHPSMTGTIVVE
jgi:plastocyanin